MVEVLGRGGQARVAEAAGMSRNTLIAGAKDLAEGPVLGERIRRPGAGPKHKIDLDPELLVVLDVRGHEKVLACGHFQVLADGQQDVPAGGHVDVLTPR
jgi:hypothetical protein